MNSIDLDFSFKGIKSVKMKTDKYTCIISPYAGSTVYRLHDDINGIEIFRYDENCPGRTIENEREVWGLPLLYLPNRFYKGIIKTSDAVYHMPINEPKLDNFIHGWVHKRNHKIENYSCDDESIVLETSYDFNKSDEMYSYFPLDFLLRIKFTLSCEGLTQEIFLTNKSEKALPVSIATHTSLNAPMTDSGNAGDMRLIVSIGEKCELNDKCNPTEKLLAPDEWDKEYITGKVPVGQVIDNDMYFAKMNKLGNKDFYGTVITDISTGHSVCNEVSPEFRFWNIWNDGGNKGYFCPEPMTAMINSPNLSLDKSVTGYREIFGGETYSCKQRFFTE